MQQVQMTASRLSELIEGFTKARIAVLGDFFLDKYLDVDPQLAEPSVETGKVAHQVIDQRCSPGAAGTVVCNLAALGAGQLHAIGFCGDDGEGYDLRKALLQLGCSHDHLHITTSRFTPTYLKPRDANVSSLDAEHSRYDTKNRTATPADVEQQVIESLDALLPNVDAVIVLDQVEQAECGVVSSRVRETICDRAQQTQGKTLFWADSRRRIHQFPHVTIKPNAFEVLGIENPLPDTPVDEAKLQSLATELRQQNQAPVVVTRAENGMMVSDPDWTVVPGVTVDGPIDPTGAGDSATAGAVLALCSGATLAEAALVGNLVASLTIQQINTTGTASPAGVMDRFQVWLEQRGAAG